VENVPTLGTARDVCRESITAAQATHTYFATANDETKRVRDLVGKALAVRETHRQPIAANTLNRAAVLLDGRAICKS
jgi:hypothetical protein